MAHGQRLPSTLTGHSVDPCYAFLRSRSAGGGMEIHKPKPVHGWREWLTEVGIVVLGVLIALGAEQAVETLHWRHRVEQTEAQLHFELLRDARSSLTWLSSSPCQEARLAGLEAALMAARTSHRVEKVLPYKPNLWLWTNDAWLNARSLQVADHLQPEAVRRYTVAYFFPRELQSDIVEINQLAAELSPLREGLDQVTPAEADGFLRTIGLIRELKSRMDLGNTRLLQAAAAMGVRPMEEDLRQARSDALQSYGPCIGNPAEIMAKFGVGTS